MTPEQTLDLITVDVLLEKVRDLRQRGYRIVQIGATRLPDRVEVTYSFDLRGQLLSLRVHLPPVEPRLPSISSIYACVVLYENEMHDLFHIKVENMAVDFQGNLYKTTVKFPFGTVKAPAVKAAATTAPVGGIAATPAVTAN
jgi:ech hydrogenase subunit D